MNPCCNVCRSRGFEPRKSGCSFCSGEYGGGRPAPRPVPAQIVYVGRRRLRAGPGVRNITILGGAAKLDPDASIRVPTLDEVWTFAPHRDHADEPRENDQWYDRGPAVRIGYEP